MDIEISCFVKMKIIIFGFFFHFQLSVYCRWTIGYEEREERKGGVRDNDENTSKVDK